MKRAVRAIGTGGHSSLPRTIQSGVPAALPRRIPKGACGVRWLEIALDRLAESFLCPELFASLGAFVDLDNLVCLDILQGVRPAADPTNFDAIDTTLVA